MSEIDDGVIKYQRDFKRTSALERDEYWLLENWRKKLFQLELIGEYPKVFIGYGNMSWRKAPAWPLRFVITGTQTGKYPDLNGDHYTVVEGYDLENNRIQAQGPIDASSEALTHASLYECSHDINAVFHIHDKIIWQGMLTHGHDATAKDIPYGTVAMAKAVHTLVGRRTHGSFAMAGHDDGVVAWGKTLDEAGEEILNLVKHFKS